MTELLKNKIVKIVENRDNEISKQFDKSMKELKEMKRNIDNIIFYRLQKEIKKNDEILIKTELDSSNQLAMMRTLTELNIIPMSNEYSSDTCINDNNNYSKTQYLLFLQSKFKSKSISSKIEPLDFWKILLKFKELEK